MRSNKRTRRAQLRFNSIIVLASRNSNCRQFFVSEFADEGTRLFYESNNSRVFGLVKPEAVAAGELGPILQAIDKASFTLSRLKMIDVGRQSVSQFECSSPGAAVAFEASVLGNGGGGGGVASRWDTLIGSLGGKVFGVTSGASAGSEAMAAFESSPSWGSPNSRDVTACVVKPHAIKEGKLGDLLTCIEHELGLKVEAMEMVSLDRNSASSFFDVYKGVYPYYNDMVAHLIEGPSVFLKISSPGSGGGCGAVETFREACGPAEVEVAKVLRPKSLRARFGTNRVSCCCCFALCFSFFFVVVDPPGPLDSRFACIKMLSGEKCSALH